MEKKIKYRLYIKGVPTANIKWLYPSEADNLNDKINSKNKVWKKD